jgi:hypothetical protein
MTGTFKAHHSVISCLGMCKILLNTLTCLPSPPSVMQTMFILSNHYNILFQSSQVLSASITKLHDIQRLHPTKYMNSSGTVHNHAKLTLALDNCEWQLHCTWVTVTHVTLSTGGWMGHRATLHAMEKRKTSFFHLMPKLRVCGALSPLSHVPSNHATQMKHFTENCQMGELFMSLICIHAQISYLTS